MTGLDSVEHLYQPVAWKMLSGAYYPDGYYALGVGSPVEAIDAENSEVIAKSFNGKFAYYTPAKGAPFSQRKADKISGCHLWMDRHYPTNAFISDALAQAFKKAGIKALFLQPSTNSGARGNHRMPIFDDWIVGCGVIDFDATTIWNRIGKS